MSTSRAVPFDSLVVSRAAEFAETVDPLDVIRSYDIDSDVPLRQGIASGLLRMTAAVRAKSTTTYAQIVELGTYWCDVVHADVEYRLDDGLRLVAQSESLAGDLTEMLKAARDEDKKGQPRAAWSRHDLAYVLARWNDGAGKIRYRTTAYSRAVRDFAAACGLATDEALWWILPDVSSNYLRARFEELRQGLSKRDTQYRRLLEDLVTGLRGSLNEAEREAERRKIMLGAPEHEVRRRRDQPTNVDALRALEFLRGYSSLLHNHSLAVNDVAWLDPAERIPQSRQASLRAGEISAALGDGYRLPQALQQQAMLAEEETNVEEARRLFGEVIRGRWRRGELIARQRLAKLPEDPRHQADALRNLLENELNAARGSVTGSDLDIRAWTVRFFAEAAREALRKLGTKSKPNAAGVQEAAEVLEGDIQRYEIDSVRAVRQVIALPMYKRGYAELVRPVYIGAASRALESPARNPKERQQHREDAFAYVEESSARELLDMLAARELTRLGRPTKRIEETVIAQLRSQPQALGAFDGRRGTANRAADDVAEDVGAVMAARAEEFEAILQRYPLEIAPHDPEIAHRVMMLAANDSGTAVVRYFLTETQNEQHVSALVARGRRMEYFRGPLRSDVRDFARALLINRAPNELEAEGLWNLLLDEVWGFVTPLGPVDHLVVVPTDEVFALPLHAARDRRAGARPLGVEVAMSYSVSATAFVSRGRHLLRRIAVDADDDLAAVVGVDADDGVSGGEIVAARWGADHVTVLGAPPSGLPPAVRVLDATWDGIGTIENGKPEFFVYIGHGGYTSEHAELGPYLFLPGDVMTQFDVALRLRLPRNKLTVLGACVAAQGMAASGGEVAGFVCSLMAAGAGAIALPLWSAKDDALVRSVGSLLRASRVAAANTGVFDVVESMRAINDHEWARSTEGDEQFEALPLALYL
jgi:CHAT domain